MKIHMLLVCLPLALGAACGDDNKLAGKDAGMHVDAGHGSGSGSGSDNPPPDASCFNNPTTNNEIINACTDADKIYKDSHPSLIGSDGQLPPLP